MDEIYGKGYCEEVDFAYRAITNGWKNVLIDDLYVYHKRQASFGAQERQKSMSQNNPEFYRRWAGFRQKYEADNKLVNPIKKIEIEMFGEKKIKEIDRKPLEYIFSVKNAFNKQSKIITILGLEIKIKRKKYSEYSFIEKIFSVKNKESRDNKWYKVITVFGVKLSFKNKELTQRKNLVKLNDKIFEQERKFNMQSSLLRKHENKIEEQSRKIIELTNVIQEQIADKQIDKLRLALDQEFTSKKFLKTSNTEICERSVRTLVKDNV